MAETYPFHESAGPGRYNLRTVYMRPFSSVSPNISGAMTLRPADVADSLFGGSDFTIHVLLARSQSPVFGYPTYWLSGDITAGWLDDRTHIFSMATGMVNSSVIGAVLPT